MLRHRFRYREHAAHITKVGASRLQVNGYWIMDTGGYPCLLQACAELIAPRYLYHINIKCMRSPWPHHWNGIYPFLQVFCIPLSYSSTSSIPLFEIAQFHSQDRGLHFIEAGVNSQHFVFVADT